MSRRLFLRLFLAFALALTGGAAQLHSLAHARFDLASAAAAHGGKAPAPLEHSTDHCLVIHALDGTAAVAGVLPDFVFIPQHIDPLPVERIGKAPVVAFRSRAPPLAA